MVEVRVTDMVEELAFNWTVTIRNVNRAPSIASFDPQSEFSMAAFMTQVLSVTVSDPDQDDDIFIEWYVDGRLEATDDLTHTYDPDSSELGERNIRVVVRDEHGASDSHEWTATVTRGGDPPPDDDDEAGVSTWALLAVAILLVILLLAVALVTLRRRG